MSAPVPGFLEGGRAMWAICGPSIDPTAEFFQVSFFQVADVFFKIGITTLGGTKVWMVQFYANNEINTKKDPPQITNKLTTA